MPRSILGINHLAFVDDMIILCKAEMGTMNMVADTLEKYEALSSQKINKEKSAIYLHHSTSAEDVVLEELLIGVFRKDFSFTYLGCPIFL